MAKRHIETAVAQTVDRSFGPEVFGHVAKQLEASGCVDQMLMWDQLVSWIAPCLWTPENSPLAKYVPDLDSYPDWNVMCAYAAALAPNLGTVISTDGLRIPPAEKMQTMLTLANATNGKATYQIGAGEIKQCKPYGHKRVEGLDRLEDFYRAFHAFWENDEPFSLDGHHLKFDRATLGKSRRQKPRIWGLGGGPRVYDLATTYADGFSTMGVMVWTNPDHAAAEIKKLKDQLEAKGRDPEKFDFSIWAPLILSEDADFVERAFENPIVKWTTCIMGRIIQSDWLKEGIQPPMPADWHYALKMLPQNIGIKEANEMMSRVTPEMSHKSWIYGDAKKAAAELQGFIDAGVTHVATIDMAPALMEPAASAAALQNSIDVCRHIKAANA
jgi:phthiodiolone/phenolphthiodiolone dimycocerosates ketoreductase